MSGSEMVATYRERNAIQGDQLPEDYIPTQRLISPPRSLHGAPKAVNIAVTLPPEEYDQFDQWLFNLLGLNPAQDSIQEVNTYYDLEHQARGENATSSQRLLELRVEDVAIHGIYCHDAHWVT